MFAMTIERLKRPVLAAAALAGLAAGLATVSAGGQGRVASAAIRDGSFTQSCRNIRVERGRLSALCRTLKGAWRPAELPNVGRCVGDIWNWEGRLFCSDAPAPEGPYLNYCKNPFTKEGALYATCPVPRPSVIGPVSRIEIDILIMKLQRYLECVEQNKPIWWDGELTCAHPTVNRASYAKKCEARLGAIGAIDCTKGERLEVYVEADKQSELVPLIYPAGSAMQACNHPAVLPLKDSKGSQCVPGSTFQILKGKTDAVKTVVLCRKYRNSSGPYFHDIAVIQHDMSNGETCFHQTRTTWPTDGGIEGTAVPGPSDESDAAAKIWLDLNPTNLGPHLGEGLVLGAYTNCLLCHDADPFIWTPYVNPLFKALTASSVKTETGQSKTGQPWNPSGPYNPFVGGLFGHGATSVAPAGNACVSCHRIGVRAWKSLSWHFSNAYNGAKLEHLMPLYPDDIADLAPTAPHPGLSTKEELEAWSAAFADDIAQLDACTGADFTVAKDKENPFPYLADKACNPQIPFLK